MVKPRQISGRNYSQRSPSRNGRGSSQSVAQTFFNHTTENGGASAGDTADYTLGAEFRFEAAGVIDKLSFWKPNGNGETGRSWAIWDAITKELLWSGTSTGEGGSGWIEKTVSPPLAIDRYRTIKIGVTCLDGFSVGANYFATEKRRGYFAAPINRGNCTYNVGATLTFPETVFGAPNYWLDLQATFTIPQPVILQGVPDPVAIPGYPNASNTGYGAQALTPATDVRSSSNGQIIENLDIFGTVYISHNNVTIRKCRIIGNTPYHCIHLDTNVGGVTTMTVEDCEIDGRNKAVNGILGNGTFQRNNIYGVQNGINGAAGTWVDNYIHALGADFEPDPHYDGIECNGSTAGLTIQHNTIFDMHTQTAAIMLNNQFAGLQNITITDNVIGGGGYTVYVDNTKGGGTVTGGTISITNNKMISGQYGYFATYTSAPVISGNTDAITGIPV